MFKYTKLILATVLTLCSFVIFSQSINTEFGKNRVQFHDDFKYWSLYETENFVTYWYGKGRNIASTVVQMAELDHDEIQNVMEHRINDKIEIVVYSDITDLKQSNVGIDQTFVNRTGETKIVGNKMFVYFDGDHKNLRRQIREGIASVYLNAMLFGTSFQEIVQNAVLLNLPEWYKEGIVEYMGSTWDHLIDDEFRDIFQREDGKYQDFEKLAGEHPRVAGHSLWYYMEQNYGRSAISNLLYLTRITRNLENSFLYVLGTSYPQIIEEWKIFYSDIYFSETDKFEKDTEDELIKLSRKTHIPVSHIRLSPDGRFLAYAHNEIGKYRIKIIDLQTGEEETIFKYGSKNAFQATDYNYPLFCWHDSRPELTIVYEHRDVIKLLKRDLPSGQVMEQIIPEDIRRIYSVSYADDENYIFSANDDGYSDLYYYRPVFREYENITKDFYDDLDATVVNYMGKKGILFVSNRKKDDILSVPYDTIIPLDNFDIFFYDLEEGNKKLVRITDTPLENERQPYVIGEDRITYLSAGTGMNNRMVADGKSSKKYINSNKERNIIIHHTVPASDQYVFSYYLDGKYNLYIETPDWSKEETAHVTNYKKKLLSDIERINNPVPFVIETEDPQQPKEKIKEGYLFQTEYEDPKELEVIDGGKKEPSFNPFPLIKEKEDGQKVRKKVIEFNSARAVAARPKFRLDNFTTKLDNEVLFEGLESYLGETSELNYLPMGLLFKANVKDLLEDHSIEVGARYPTSFNGSEYFVVYEDRKKLIDKKYALYRQTQTADLDENTFPSVEAKKNSLLGLYQLKYPFDIYRSVRATSSLRFDRYYFQSSDDVSLNQPITNEKRISLKLEYVFDNSFDVDLNIKNGTRYKFYVEAINKFNVQVLDGFEADLNQGFTTVVGFDARHYIPVLSHSVLALRAAGATSFGSEKIMYYLGGVNNWLFSSFNDNIPQPNNINFAYKTAALQMRGFKSNIRNGGTFALMNSELRIPIFKYILGKNIKSSLFRNFQTVFFYDVGTAWHGFTPYSDKNPLNTLQLESGGIIEVDVEYFRDPLVMGFGVGARTSLLGYFIKVDYAWGIETRSIQDPIFYLSIGTDF